MVFWPGVSSFLSNGLVINGLVINGLVTNSLVTYGLVAIQPMESLREIPTFN